MAPVDPIGSLQASGVEQQDSNPDNGRVNGVTPEEVGGVGEDTPMEIDADDTSSAVGAAAVNGEEGAGVEPEIGPQQDQEQIMQEGEEGDAEADPDVVAVTNDEGKRVKAGNRFIVELGESVYIQVYELREQSWFDRGTGHCKGVYDDSQDIALIIVEPESNAEKGEADDGPGGFLKDDLLLSNKVEKDDIYARQQDTLIVWTEPTTNLDIALSFQDADGCEDIWQFICEVQKHLNNLPSENDQAIIPSSSSPLSASPLQGLQGSSGSATETRTPWQAPTLANIREHLQLLRMQSRSPPGRERAVEHILSEDYIKQLISVFEQAEDLESVDDLHTLCTLMQAIIMFNDNGILEYILQDDVFIGVIGMLEYDPEFPSLKASFRQFFKEISKFRQVVEIRDTTIRTKIHQTYRLQYLKEVVLARLLDDPTFGILNGFIFFNQVDIIAYFQSNPQMVYDIFDVYKGENVESPSEEMQQKQKDTITFLHQLMLMGKTTQIPTRLALYRSLVHKGLLIALQWALGRSEATIVHPGAEMLTLMVEHDANAVRGCVLEDAKTEKRTLVDELIQVMGGTANMGLMSQIADTFKTLLESPAETETFAQKADGRVNEKFLTHVYEQCFESLFKPLLEFQDITANMEPPPILDRPKAALLGHLVELLSFCVTMHGHRASYFVMSNPIARKTVSLLYLKEKPLRHAALRFVKACFKTGNHFMNRHFVKSDLLSPVIALMEEESKRDNMLNSACMDILEVVRKDNNTKPVITYMFETHRARLQSLSQRPFFRAPIQALHSKYEQWTAPPPAPSTNTEAETSTANATREKEIQEDEYFNASDEEEKAATPTTHGPVTYKRKRGNSVIRSPDSSPGLRRSERSPAKSGTTSHTYQSPQFANRSATRGSVLGLDYDDNSDSTDSEGSTGNTSSPRAGPSAPQPEPDLAPTEELAEDLGDVAMKMRSKRQREEEDDEGFAGLLSKATAMGGGNPAKSSDTEETGEKKGEKQWLSGFMSSKYKDKDKDKDKVGSPKVKEEGGKKIRLNLGVKRIGGYLQKAAEAGGVVEDVKSPEEVKGDTDRVAE